MPNDDELTIDEGSPPPELPDSSPMPGGPTSLPNIVPPAMIVTDPKAPGATSLRKDEHKFIEVAGPCGIILIAEKDLQNYISRGFRTFRRG